jgi:hypothetical protein
LIETSSSGTSQPAMAVWFLQALTGYQHEPPIKAHDDPHWGMHPALYAFIFVIVSGLSLPIGAALGIIFSPVKDKTCALMMAFGAGALLFAVTVELYGHALAEVQAGRLGLIEIFTTIFGALCGAAFYLSVNQWLEQYLMDDDELAALDAESGTKTAPANLEKNRKSISATSGLMESLRKQQEAKEAAEKADKEAAASSPISPKRTGKQLWSKARLVKSVTFMTKEGLSGIRGREKALRALNDADTKHAKSVAFALFLGLLVDGVPEGILMGFLSAEGHLTPVLIISLFVANFPEAFSSASLLIQAQMSIPKIIGMWSGLCLLVGSLGGLSCYLLLLWFPKFGSKGSHEEALPMSALIGIALTEGITGGAMIACISSVMLPEAFERAGKTGAFYAQSGFWCCSGFLLSVALKALFG